MLDTLVRSPPARRILHTSPCCYTSYRREAFCRPSTPLGSLLFEQVEPTAVPPAPAISFLLSPTFHRGTDRCCTGLLLDSQLWCGFIYLNFNPCFRRHQTVGTHVEVGATSQSSTHENKAVVCPRAECAPHQGTLGPKILCVPKQQARPLTDHRHSAPHHEPRRFRYIARHNWCVRRKAC